MNPGEKDPKVQMIAYPRRSQRERLKELSEKTRIPQAALVREALDLLFEKHSSILESCG